MIVYNITVQPQLCCLIWKFKTQTRRQQSLIKLWFWQRTRKTVNGVNWLTEYQPYDNFLPSEKGQTERKHTMKNLHWVSWFFFLFWEIGFILLNNISIPISFFIFRHCGKNNLLEGYQYGWHFHFVYCSLEFVISVGNVFP